jgi:hypothetical protein
MERFLRERASSSLSLQEALGVALDAWAVGYIAQREGDLDEFPSDALIVAERNEQLIHAAIEAGVLDRTASSPVTWRSLPEAEVRDLLEDR